MRDEYAGEAAGAYLRVSSQGQATEDKTSLEEQQRSCYEYAERLGLVMDVGCVEREVYTGTTTQRPGWQRLLRTLRTRGVRHLVIDKADRFSREGILAASRLLNELVEANITLHVAYERLIVQDERDVQYFLQLMFYARKDNEIRTDRIKSNKHAYVRRGRYMRGNRAPLGWKYEPTQYDAKGKPIEYKLVHDEETGPLRERILKMYQQGYTYNQIAKILTDEQVPTSRQLAQQKHAGVVWYPQVVRNIVESPLNTGAATSIRQRVEKAPPDERHSREWRKQVPLAPEQHITLPAGTVEPFLTNEAMAQLAARKERNKRQKATYQHWSKRGILSGGLATCSCGRSLHFHAMKKQTKAGGYYFYYGCRLHDEVPALCPVGVRVRAEELEAIVWKEVQATLLEPDKLHRLTAAQAAADASEDPLSHLASLKRARDSLHAKCQRLAAAIGETASELARQTLRQELEKWQPAVQEAEQRIKDYEQLAKDQVRRLQILADIAFQTERYHELLVDLEVEVAWMRPTIQGILQSLGCSARVTRGSDRSLDVQVTLHLNQTSLPWFSDTAIEFDEESGELDWGEANISVATPDDPSQTFSPVKHSIARTY